MGLVRGVIGGNGYSYPTQPSPRSPIRLPGSDARCMISWQMGRPKKSRSRQKGPMGTKGVKKGFEADVRLQDYVDISLTCLHRERVDHLPMSAMKKWLESHYQHQFLFDRDLLPQTLLPHIRYKWLMTLLIPAAAPEGYWIHRIGHG